MNRLPLLIFALLAASACSISYYQVATVTPESGTGELEEGKAYAFKEYGEIHIAYNFWEEGGNAGFLVWNNSDEDITIDLGESYFIMNGFANDYYLRRTYSAAVRNSAVETEEAVAGIQNGITGTMSHESGNFFTSKTFSAYSSSYLSNIDMLSNSETVSVQIEEQRFINIPARSAKYFEEYSVSETVFTRSDFDEHPGIKDIAKLEFSIEESPIVFENRITIIDHEERKHKICHKFYVSELTNKHHKNIEYDQKKYYNKYVYDKFSDTYSVRYNASWRKIESDSKY